MFGDLLKATINTVVLPVKVAADVVTLGGALTDKKDKRNQDTTYTGEQISKIMKNLDDSTK